MSFRTLLVPELPPLAWAVVRRAHDEAALVLHGADVVVGDDFVAEGAWLGGLNREAFGTSPVLFGTGFHELGDGRLRFRGPPHPTERLWTVEWPGAVVVSNSLPFALSAADTRLVREHAHYEADLLCFLRGPMRMRRQLPTADGKRLRQHCGVLLQMGPDLRVERAPDRIAAAGLPPLGSFRDYVEHMTTVCAGIITNLADPGRPRCYRPLATLSTGYDSPACAVIARNCGVSEAVTFRTARSDYADTDDDGSGIGRQLGLEVWAMERDAYREGDGSAEWYSLAGGGGGEDVTFASIGPLLEGRCLVTGYQGDSVWGLEPNPELLHGEKPFPGGTSFAELRIHRSFVHAPLPWLDLFRQPSIVGISQAPEMEAWRIGGSYDRPIPRRLVEEAGVPRAAFGRIKKATSAPLYYHRAVQEALGPEARASFDAWLDEVDPAPVLERYGRGWRRRKRLNALRERVADIADRYPSPGWLEHALRPRLCDRFRRPPDPSLLAVVWAVETCQAEYRRVLRTIPS